MMTTDGGREAAKARARAAAAQRQKLERGWKRLILIGALASFVSILGAVSLQDGISGDSASQPSLTNPSEQDQRVIIRRVRTRSS